VGIEHEQQKPQKPLEEQGVPEISVVRSNTSRPFSFETFVAQNGESGLRRPVGWPHDATQAASEIQAAFPHEAPTAPPVPEEVDEQGEGVRTNVAVESTPLPLSQGVAMADATEQEFVWLFEYGMEMDHALLNSSDRLNNAALLYGPAVLKGYTLTFSVGVSQQQKVVATIAPSSARRAEVWGIAYRIPRRLIGPRDNELSQLDRVHGAVPPNNMFERVEVVVTEAYRGRELSCLTYIAAHIPHQRVALGASVDTAYLHRLLEIARKQKLPDNYIQALAASSMDGAATNIPQSPPTEQNTEPLPVVVDRQESSLQISSVEPVQDMQPVQNKPLPQSRNTSVMVFVCVSSLLLLAALILAVIQGLGIAGNVFTSGFTPLNVPWYVLLYGVIGGSISCLVTLERRYGQVGVELPNFVLIVWCSRPLIGVVLAMLSYLFLNAGLFMTAGSAEQHVMLSSLLAVLASLCEGWLFKQRFAQ